MENAYNEMTEDGRLILKEFISIVIKNGTRKTPRIFPKNYVEAQLGYVSYLHVNGALKELGFFTTNDLKTQDLDSKMKFKWSWTSARLGTYNFDLHAIIEECAFEKDDIPNLLKYADFIDKNGVPDNLSEFSFDKKETSMTTSEQT
jgi:hypothetical protein